MNTKNVAVSIVVIFDKLRTTKLIRLLNSIGQQATREHAEILLLQESDTPLEQPEFITVFAKQLAVPITYKNIKAKQGIPYNRNKGIKFSQGETIVFIDDDCWVQDQWLHSLLMPLHQKQKIAGNTILATTGATHIPQANFVGNCISALGFPGGGTLGFERVWKVSPEGLTNHLAVGNCALRKELFTKIGVFDETMKSGAEDAELSFRMEKANIPILYVPDAYAYHEARTTFSSFIKWQLRRGKANYQFKQKVGNVGSFIKLRIWSAKNIFKKNILNWRLPFILFFLGLSFVLQQFGFYQEKKHQNKLSFGNKH